MHTLLNTTLMENLYIGLHILVLKTKIQMLDLLCIDGMLIQTFPSKFIKHMHDE